MNPEHLHYLFRNIQVLPKLRASGRLTANGWRLTVNSMHLCYRDGPQRAIYPYTVRTASWMSSNKKTCRDLELCYQSWNGKFFLDGPSFSASFAWAISLSTLYFFFLLFFFSDGVLFPLGKSKRSISKRWNRKYQGKQGVNQNCNHQEQWPHSALMYVHKVSILLRSLLKPGM